MARHAPRCAECGAPTRPQRAGGVPSLVCVACGATTVDARAPRDQRPGDPTAPPVRTAPAEPSHNLPDDLTLEEPVLSLEGLAALGEAGFESELEHLRAQRRRQLGMLALMGLSGAAFVVLVPMLIVGVGALRVLLAPEGPDAPSLPVAIDVEEGTPDPVAPEPAPAEPALEAAAGGEPGEGAAGPDAPEESEEAVEPAPAPKPAPVDPVRVLIQKGWAVASRTPSEGAERFREALELAPRHPEASYGLGYCLLKQGDLEGARQHLCVARTSSKPDIRRDVDALLANNGMTCSP